MNYPIWQLDFAGGGLLIAGMAILHVYISHFAIGGGLFLVVTEIKAYREESPDILEYVRKHTRFFLLLTLVLGALTGVGIWFTISLLNPAATSILIHNFVFAWAIEWVFFLCEIVSIMVYYYTFGKMGRARHLLLGWAYFVFAWLSLFVINGIIDFMLTPGAWLTTGNFRDGFFNPTFWPALFFRTFLALMLAGLFGFVTASRLKQKDMRENMIRYCALWLLAPFFFMLASANWYIASLANPLSTTIFKRAPELVPFVKTFVLLSPILFVGGLILAVQMPARIKKSLALAMLFIGLVYMGAFEFVREGGRRPYIIYDYLYSNNVPKARLEAIRREGILQNAKWVRHRTITEDNALAAGYEVFNVLCLACHSIGGPMNDILALTGKYDNTALEARILGLGVADGYMPPFAGNDAERKALAAFIVQGLHGKPKSKPRQVRITERDYAVPPFNAAKDDYLLLAWNSLGMHYFTDSGRFFMLQPPGNNLAAQLIKRGEVPELVSEGVTIRYEVQEEFARPQDQVEFWNFSQALLGRRLPPGTGLAGKGVKGTMVYEAQRGKYTARRVPVVPYAAGGQFMPYPLFTIDALDQESKLLARTRIVGPVSTEMGCMNCHGGGWRIPGIAGVSDLTAEDVLASHDRLSRTSLVRKAESDNPMRCQSCHPDSSLDMEGRLGLLNLSAAIHGFHAPFLAGRDADACAFCHPTDPQGATRYFRGIHSELGLDCTYCHGPLEDHALSLLLAEKAAGKETASQLIRNISPRNFGTVDEIKPRRAWEQQPDCLNCHTGFQPPETIDGFNAWTDDAAGLYRNREAEGGIKCVACHGSSHAIYPATNAYGVDRDNILPIQYQGNPYPIGSNKNCRVCHIVDREYELHHPNMLRMFRNVR